MLWNDFLNSEWHDWRGSGWTEDRLDNNDWLEKWLAAHHLSIAKLPTTKEMAALKRLRLLLLNMVKKLVSGFLPIQEDIDKLNQAIAQGTVIRRISLNGDNYQLVLAPLKQSWPQIMAEVAASFAQTLTEGEPSRFRICDNEDCLWVYYDDTRNRSKRYCDDKMCGNLMKVRRFRARKKADDVASGLIKQDDYSAKED
jgi:predicted RNA-binding Zn ribbon-like protein